MPESPLDKFLRVRLDFLVVFWVLGALPLDLVRDAMILVPQFVHGTTPPAAHINECATYYSTNAWSFEFDYLIPIASLIGTFAIVLRLVYRRGLDDLLGATVGAAMAAAVKIWLEPNERALIDPSLSLDDKLRLLIPVGLVHVSQLHGCLLIVFLHWRALFTSPSPATDTSSPVTPGNRDAAPPAEKRVVEGAAQTPVLGCYHDIVKHYRLQTVKGQNLGFLEWRGRMGVHMAYHSKPGNWIGTHVTGTSLNVLLLLALFYSLWSWTGVAALALPVLLLYALCDFAIGLLIAVIFFGFAMLAPALCECLSPGALAMAFALLFPFQIVIGHWYFEEGIDDSDINFTELLSDPRPFLLLPFYTFVDVFFLFGLFPSTRRTVQTIRNELRPQLMRENAANAQNPPAFKDREFLILGCIITIGIVVHEFFNSTHPVDAAPSLLGRFLVVGSGLGIVDWAWLHGLRDTAELLSRYGLDRGGSDRSSTSELLQPFMGWALWYLGLFGLFGAVTGLWCSGLLFALGALAMGVEKSYVVAVFFRGKLRTAPAGRESQALRYLALYDAVSCISLCSYSAGVLRAVYA